MTLEIVFMLMLLLLIIVFFTLEWLPIDLTALIVLIILLGSGILSPQQAFSGFANEIIFILASIFIMSSTLTKSGVTHILADYILSGVKKNNGLLFFLMTLVASLSAFFSNTSSTAILLPVTLKIAEKAKVRASKLLMPLAYASILGGTCTLIGTSTNLASAGLIERMGMAPFSLFEFIIPGLVMTVIGILYISIIGYRFIPQREKESLVQDYLIRNYLSEIVVEPDSQLIGKRVATLRKEYSDITPLKLIRQHKSMQAHGNTKLLAGDKIIIKCTREALLEAHQDGSFSISAEPTFTQSEISTEDVTMSEFILMPQSRFIGRTLKQLELNAYYQISVLAIYRGENAHPVQIRNTKLKMGDVLLLQAEQAQLDKLATSFPELWVSQSAVHMPLTIRKGVLVLIAMLVAVLLTAVSDLPSSVAFISAVVLLVLSRCVTMEEAYDSIQWKLLVLIACMSSFGLAMQETGTSTFIATLIVDFTTPFGLRATMAALAVLAVILTQPMSNAAAALVLLPVALSAADLLGVDARPFLVMVTLSASLSFITPLEPASLLVYGAGKYKFLDFVKAGLPLTFIVVAILVFLVPILWPFNG